MFHLQKRVPEVTEPGHSFDNGTQLWVRVASTPRTSTQPDRLPELTRFPWNPRFNSVYTNQLIFYRYFKHKVWAKLSQRDNSREKKLKLCSPQKPESQCLLYPTRRSALFTRPSVSTDILHLAPWTTPSDSAYLFSYEKNIWKYALPRLSWSWGNSSTSASLRITWRAHSDADSWAPPTRNLYFYQVSRWFWSYWSHDHPLRTTALCPLDQSFWDGGNFFFLLW